jgi:Mg2+-importing ATPase
MDEEFLARPRRWDPTGIARFMLFVGPVSSVFDVLTFLLMWFVFHADAVAHQAALFQSGWFVVGLLTQTLIVHVIRTERIPFVQSRAAAPVLAMTAVIMGRSIVLPFTSSGHAVGLVPLPWSYFPWLLALLLSYCALAQVVKRWYVHHFGAWL